MKAAWRRLGSPDAISWIGTLALVVQQLAGTLAAPLATVEGRYLELIAIRMLALCITFVGLALGKLLLLRFARTRPMPLLTLAVFIGASIADILSYDALVELAGFTDSATIGQRLILAVPGRLTILIVCGLLVTYSRESARANQLLADTVDELLSTRNEAATRFAARTAALVSSIREEISNALASVNPNAPEGGSGALRSLLDEVVRPMSYRLLADVPTEDRLSKAPPNPKVSWARVFERAMAGHPVHPVVTTLWMGALAGTFLTTSFGIPGAIATAVYIAWLWSSFTLAGQTWRFLPAGLPALLRGMLFTGFVTGSVALAAPVITVISGYPLTRPVQFTGWVILMSCIAWSVTLVYAVNGQLRDTNSELELVAEELRREVITLNNQFRLLQKGAARVLHGPVQEAISVALARHSTTPGIAQNELLHDLASRVNAALDGLVEPSETTLDLATTFAELAELWEDVVTIDVAAVPTVLHRIEADPLAGFSVVEVIREACGNAIRHGNAQNIWIRIDASTADSVVTLQIDNDGKRLPSRTQPGLGSQLFDETCLSWTRRQVGDLVWLEARIPLTS